MIHNFIEICPVGESGYLTPFMFECVNPVLLCKFDAKIIRCPSSLQL